VFSIGIKFSDYRVIVEVSYSNFS